MQIVYAIRSQNIYWIDMTKEALRKIYRAKRKDLGGHERLRMDDLMLIQFQQFDFTGIHTLLTYWPLPDQAEPNTHLFSGYLRHMVPGLQICYPVSNPIDFSMTAHLINENTVYTVNEWGITEPPAVHPVPAMDIDLVFVPMLICDEQGYRVGYGKGFYDRYLVTCRPDTVMMGFSYFDPVPLITDTDEFDVPLQYCITPKVVYEF